jgi:hypothetical protein
MKITSTVTTPAAANAWRRFGRWTRMDEDSRTTASGLWGVTLGVPAFWISPTTSSTAF